MNADASCCDMSPKVSVITVNFNMGSELGATLDSVLDQDYFNFESIVIDGGSVDQSLDVLREYASRLSYWVSEPDENLYDAMNKGVRAACGEWIVFMNSGDRFSSSDVLTKMFTVGHHYADVIYGNHVRFYPALGIKRLIIAEAPTVLPFRMNCCHQSVFMRRRFLLERPFSLEFLAAGYDRLLDAYTSGLLFDHVDCVVAVASTGGRSDKQRLRSLLERVSIVRRHGRMTPRIAVYYGRLIAQALIAPAIKKAIPRGLLTEILKRRPINGLG